jgi:hypothetical protein
MSIDALVPRRVSQEGTILSVDAFFCSLPNDYAVIGGPGVLFTDWGILPSSERTYYFYANVA